MCALAGKRNWQKLWQGERALRLLLGFVDMFFLLRLRKNRIFRRKFSNSKCVVIDIENYVRAKAWQWRVSRNYANWVVCKNWGLGE